MKFTYDPKYYTQSGWQPGQFPRGIVVQKVPTQKATYPNYLRRRVHISAMAWAIIVLIMTFLGLIGGNLLTGLIH